MVDGKMDCGHHRDALIWDDDLKKEVCSACRAEAVNTSFLKKALESSGAIKRVGEEMGDMIGRAHMEVLRKPGAFSKVSMGCSVEEPECKICGGEEKEPV
jgi:hypothetical protein